MAFKTTYSQYDNKTGLFSTEGALDLTTTPSNENKITASDGAANDSFGTAVAVGSGRIVVSSTYAYSAAGSAYIFDLDGNNEIKIQASDGAAGHNYGVTLAVNNEKIVIGAYGATIGANSGQGAAYIYDLDGTNETKLTVSGGIANAFFGISVAVGNGKIVVGSAGDTVDGNFFQGSAYIFNLDGTQLTKLTVSDGAEYDFFGISVAVGSGRIVVGARGDDSNKGSAYIFDLDGNQLAKITASDGAANDYFGHSVAIGHGKIVVGAYQDEDDGNDSGSAYIYDLDGTNETKITASDAAADDQFGISVAVDNGKIVVGAKGHDTAGAAYIYDLDGTNETKITASDRSNASDLYAYAVAVGSGKVVATASGDSSSKGAAYTYDTSNIKDIFSIVD